MISQRETIKVQNPNLFFALKEAIQKVRPLR